MIKEIAELKVQAGAEEMFEIGVAAAVPLFKRARGCRTMRLERSIEQPETYRLVIEWDSLEDHEVHFRDSPDFQEWRKLVAGCFAAPPHVIHTTVRLVGF